ncbi:MAG: thioesterase [Victivallaceae bacterium]|nr:thioesterase [Victivallaceae bacterium]
MENVWREKHKIFYSRFDRDGRLKIDAWSDLLQEAAATHADHLGVGMRDLAEKGLFWVLAQIRVAVSGDPAPGEIVEVATYPSGGRRLFATREFRISGADGRILLEGSSRWVMLATGTGRPQSFQLIADKLPDNSDLPVRFDFAEKLPAPENFDFSASFPVRHSMEDLNGHLNNAGYLAAAQDTLRIGGGNETIRGYEIVYHKALRFPETLTLKMKKGGDAALFTGFNDQRERCVSGALFFR